MKHAAIFSILAVGLLVGWYAPEASDKLVAAAATDGGATDTAAGEARLDVVQQDQWMAGEVVLERASDGHFYADITVDGSTSNMLVDTGASVIALTGEDAEAMGVYWDETAVEPVASGASGPVYGVRVKLDSVQLGQLEARDVDAVVVPEGLGISLLGQSFLSQIERVEIDRDKMTLGG